MIWKFAIKFPEFGIGIAPNLKCEPRVVRNTAGHGQLRRGGTAWSRSSAGATSPRSAASALSSIGTATDHWRCGHLTCSIWYYEAAGLGYAVGYGLASPESEGLALRGRFRGAVRGLPAFFTICKNMYSISPRAIFARICGNTFRNFDSFF